MHNYEVEIKSLLGVKENAEKLLDQMRSDPSFEKLGKHNELNHYFVGENLKKLLENIQDRLTQEEIKRFQDIIDNVKSFSVRTRWANDKVILVIKASVDDTTSSNGTARIELEPVMKDFTLEQLDELVLKSGFNYQAKWSRERQEFKYKDMNVSIDKNAGYGYLAEFEKIADDPSKLEDIKKEIREVMQSIGVVELDQNRLARMFDYYNHNWRNYYGTEKVFNIE